MWKACAWCQLVNGWLCSPADDGISGLCYGRVARDARPEPGTGIFWVSVEVSEGQFRDMLSTDIYSFRSARSASSARPAYNGIAPESAEPEAAQDPDGILTSPAVAPVVGRLSLLPLHALMSSRRHQGLLTGDMLTDNVYAAAFEVLPHTGYSCMQRSLPGPHRRKHRCWSKGVHLMTRISSQSSMQAFTSH